MGFLGNIFNDVVDIASAPIKVVASVADKVLETEIEEFVEDVADSAKVEEKK